MNNFISFNVSKRLNRIISNCGKILIKGVFKVSIKINNIKREIKVNSIEYSKPYQEEQPIAPRHRICLTCASRSN